MLVEIKDKILDPYPEIKRDKTMADKFIYIPNDDKQIHTFVRLQLVVETFGYST